VGKCICPSEFDVPVQVVTPETLPNSSGGQVVTFQPWFTAWAKVQLGARSEQFREDKIKGIKFYTLTMHYDARITDEHAMLIDGQLWNIRTVDGVDGKKEFMYVVIQMGVGA
jgi:SPP1 family predicted phage head-tail adaptor